MVVLKFFETNKIPGLLNKSRDYVWMDQLSQKTSYIHIQ